MLDEPNNKENFEYRSLMDYLLIIAQNLRWVIITPFITCTITIIYVLFIADPVYTSSTKIIPVGGKSGDLSSLASQFGVTLPAGGESTISSSTLYPQIIKSRTLAKALLNRKFDTEKYGPQKSLLQILTYGDDKPEVGQDTLIKIATEFLPNMFVVTEDRQSSVYTLEVSVFEPKLSADLATAVVEELDQLQRRFRTQKIIEKRTFIEERIESTEKELEAAEETLKDFRGRNRNIQNSPALSLEQERHQRDVQVKTGIFITLKQQYELARIEEVQESSFIQILDPPEVPLLRSKPQRRKSVLLAGILGIGLSLGIIFSKEYYNNSDKTKKMKLLEDASNEIKDLFALRFKP